MLNPQLGQSIFFDSKIMMEFAGALHVTREIVNYYVYEGNGEELMRDKRTQKHTWIIYEINHDGEFSNF
jgi:hypothetical protein